jgi:hypothetical protein
MKMFLPSKKLLSQGSGSNLLKEQQDDVGGVRIGSPKRKNRAMNAIGSALAAQLF